MQLSKIMKFFLPMVLVLGISPASAQYDLGRCVELLTSSMSTNSICDSMTIYMKCIVKEMDLHNLGLSDSVLQLIQEQMDAQFAQNGAMNCDLDMAAIVKEVQQEVATGVDETTRKPPTFATSTDLGECITSLTNAGIAAGGITCSLASEYTKCTIRVMDFLDTNPTTEAIQAFKETMETQLQAQGLYCNLDIQKMVDEIKEEGSGAIKPMTTPFPWNFNGFGPGSDQSWDVGRCVDLLTSTISTSEFCDAMKVYMKCIVKEMNLHNLGLSESVLQLIQDQMDAQFAENNLTNCNLDMVAIVEEVRQEEATGVAKTTRRPPTFQTSTSLGDCITALTNAGLAAGGISCSLAADYTKCTLRVMDFLATNPTTESIQEFKRSMETQLQAQGLYCNLNIQGIVDELKGLESKTTTTLATTTTAARTTQLPWNFNGNFSQCLNAFQNAGNDFCRAVNEVLKCFMRKMPSGFEQLSSSQKRQFETEFRQILGQYTSVDCSFNAEALAEEVRKERNGANTQLRPLHSVFVAISTLVTIFIAKIL